MSSYFDMSVKFRRVITLDQRKALSDILIDMLFRIPKFLNIFSLA